MSLVPRLLPRQRSSIVRLSRPEVATAAREPSTAERASVVVAPTVLAKPGERPRARSNRAGLALGIAGVLVVGAAIALWATSSADVPQEPATPLPRFVAPPAIVVAPPAVTPIEREVIEPDVIELEVVETDVIADEALAPEVLARAPRWRPRPRTQEEEAVPPRPTRCTPAIEANPYLAQ